MNQKKKDRLTDTHPYMLTYLSWKDTVAEPFVKSTKKYQKFKSKTKFFIIFMKN